MAQFDLGNDLLVVREVPCGPDRAWELARRVLEGYEPMGYRVAFDEEARPTRIVARVTDSEGTRIVSRVSIEPQGRGAHLQAHLSGTVHVGGMQGMLAGRGTVRKVARERLEGLLDRTFAGVEPEPDPPANAGDGGPSEASGGPPPPPQQGPPAGSESNGAPPADGASAESGPDSADGSAESLEERLVLVKDLYDRDLIDAEDFRRTKRRILEEL